MNRFVVSSLALVACAGMAQADIYSGGAGGAIPDATTSNSPTGFGEVVLGLGASNAAAPTINSLNSVSITIGHSWVGDLLITLRSPAGTSADVLIRSGGTSSSSFGTQGNFGTSGNSPATGTDTYTFVNSGGTAFPTGNTTFIPGGTYNRVPLAVPAVIATGMSGNDFSVFNGQDLNGTWQLTVRDFGGGDVGSVVGWSLDITSSGVPTPGAAALLGLGGMIAGRRRR